MINIEMALRSDRLMKAVTGVSADEFNKLLPGFTEESGEGKLIKVLIPGTL